MIYVILFFLLCVLALCCYTNYTLSLEKKDTSPFVVMMMERDQFALKRKLHLSKMSSFNNKQRCKDKMINITDFNDHMKVKVRC